MSQDDTKSREQLLAEIDELRERIDLLESERRPEDDRAGQLEDDLRLARLLSEAASDNPDTHEVARILASEIQRVYDLHSVNLYVLTRDGSALEMQNIGISPGLLAGAERILGQRIPLVRLARHDDSYYWRAVDSGEVTVYRTREEIADIINEFQLVAPVDVAILPGDRADIIERIIKVLAFECSVHIPLVARGQALGVLSVSARRQLDDAEIARIASIGQQVAGILAFARAEQDWRRERDRADRYLDAAPGFMLVLGVDGRVRAINQAGCEILGLQEDQIIGRDWAESFIPEQFREGGSRRIADILTGNSDQVFDGHALTARGEVRLVRWRTTALKNESGAVTGLFATGTDLTRIAESEEREERARRRFRAIIENATAVLLIVDAEGFVTYASPSLTPTLGYKVHEFMGRNCFEFVHPDDAGPIIEAFRQGNVRGGLTPTYEMRIRHKDGSWKVLEGKAKHVLDNPDIEGIILAARDVTDRVRIEDSIERSAARFRALLENSHEIMLVLGPDLRIRYASPSCARDLGYSEGTLAGLSFEEIVHGGDLDRSLFDPESEHEGPVGVRMRLRTEGREWVSYEVTVTRMLDDPAVEGFIVNANRACCLPDGHAHSDS